MIPVVFFDAVGSRRQKKVDNGYIKQQSVRLMTEFKPVEERTPKIARVYSLLVRTEDLRIFFRKTIIQRTSVRAISNYYIAQSLIQPLKISSNKVILWPVKLHFSILESIISDIIWRTCALNNLT